MRAATRALIAALAPGDAREEADIAFALNWIDSGAPLWRRGAPATPPIHLVSYCALVADGHVLLGDHRKAGLWLPPGGHVEPAEHPREAARREAREELAGLEAAFLTDAPVLLSVQRDVGASRHTDVSLWFALRGDRTRRCGFDGGEFRALRWWPMSGLPAGRSRPDLARLAARLAARGLAPAQGGTGGGAR